MRNKSGNIVTFNNIDKATDITMNKNKDNISKENKKHSFFFRLFKRKESHFNYTRDPYLCGRCGKVYMIESGFWIFRKLKCPNCGRIWRAYKAPKE